MEASRVAKSVRQSLYLNGITLSEPDRRWRSRREYFKEEVKEG